MKKYDRENCPRCGGTGWQQRATIFLGRIKARPCPFCIPKEKP